MTATARAPHGGSLMPRTRGHGSIFFIPSSPSTLPLAYEPSIRNATILRSASIRRNIPYPSGRMTATAKRRPMNSPRGIREFRGSGKPSSFHSDLPNTNLYSRDERERVNEPVEASIVLTSGYHSTVLRPFFSFRDNTTKRRYVNPAVRGQ